MTEAKLRMLEHPATTAVGVAALIQEAAGRPHGLQIDITDPPSPVRAHVCTGTTEQLVVESSSADEATKLLGRELARAHREKAAKDGK